MLFTYCGIDEARIEPYPSAVAAASLELATKVQPRRYRTVLYWRPLVPGLNDTTSTWPAPPPSVATPTPLSSPGCSTGTRSPATTRRPGCRSPTRAPPAAKSCRKPWSSGSWKAADRYHHLDTEIRPRLKAGQTVISDRYIPSGLVMQRFDGVDPAFLWAPNAEADRPDLCVILEADPEVIARRSRWPP